MSGLRIGAIFPGYCEGYLGRDAYGDKRVEAIGADWIVWRFLRNGRTIHHHFDSPLEMEELAAKWMAEEGEQE